MSTTPAAGLRVSPFNAIRWLLVAASLFVFTACSSLEVMIGTRVRLEKIALSPHMRAMLATGPGIAPCENAALIVMFTLPDGSPLMTEGAGNGKVLWEDVQITSTVVYVDPNGIVSLARDPRASEGQVPHVTITVPSHPELRAELDIPIHYNRAFSSVFSGRAGSDGCNGINGDNGVNGRPGSLDAEKPSPGSNGTNGCNGTDGQNGEPGSDAPALQVTVTLKPGPQPFLQVSVSDGANQDLFLIDPAGGGSLTINSLGGSGGAGGKGGCGGTGGSGGKGIPNGRNGHNGENGRDGWDAPKGHGGAITMTYDPSATAYLSLVQFHNDGGPSPEYREAPVAPLW